jgi:hypothetical protein
LIARFCGIAGPRRRSAHSSACTFGHLDARSKSRWAAAIVARVRTVRWTAGNWYVDNEVHYAQALGSGSGKGLDCTCAKRVLCARLFPTCAVGDFQFASAIIEACDSESKCLIQSRTVNITTGVLGIRDAIEIEKRRNWSVGRGGHSACTRFCSVTIGISILSEPYSNVVTLHIRHNFEEGREGDPVTWVTVAGIRNYDVSGNPETHLIGRALQTRIVRCFRHAHSAGQDVSSATAIELARVLPLQATEGRHQGRSGLTTGTRVMETLTKGKVTVRASRAILLPGATDKGPLGTNKQ